MPSKLTGVPILDNMKAVIKQYDSSNKILVLVLAMADFNLATTGDPLGVALDLSQRCYESATISMLQAYFNLQRVASGSTFKNLNGVSVNINEDYLLYSVKPAMYGPADRFSFAGFVDPQNLTPWKYKNIELTYKWVDDFPTLENLPSGYKQQGVRDFNAYPSGSCFGYYSPYLVERGVLVAKQVYTLAYGETEACNILIVPCEWLQVYTEVEGLPEEYMGNGDILGCLSPWTPTDPDYDPLHPCFISRKPGLSLCETWDLLSEDPDSPFWGNNFEQRAQYHLRNAGIRHELLFEGSYVILLVAKVFEPESQPEYKLYHFTGTPQTYIHLPPILPMSFILGQMVNAPFGVSAKVSPEWSEMIDGSWFLSGNRRMLSA